MTTQECISSVTSRVMILNRTIDREIKKQISEAVFTAALSAPQRLVLLIDCAGGEIEQALQVYDAMVGTRIEIIGIAVGECCSSAMLILQACTRRIALPHARFMCHNPRFTHKDTVTLESAERFRIDLATRLESTNEFFRLLCVRTTRSLDLTQLIPEGDQGRDFSAQRAKELGFVDDVLSDVSPYINHEEAA